MEKTALLLVLGLLLAFGVPALHADTLRLRNGRTIEGLITRETPEEVTIDMGVGAVTLKRGVIASIERSTGDQTEKIRSDWQHRYFTHAQYIPRGLEGLAEKFRSLVAARKSAVQALADLDRIRRRRSELKAEAGALKQRMLERAGRIRKINANRSRSTYRQLVIQQNKARSRLLEIVGEEERLDEQNEEARKAVSSYLSRLPQFENTFAGVTARYGRDGLLNEENKVFFSEIDKRLKAYHGEFEQVTIPFEPRRGHMVLKAELNDTLTGRFLLDTGATYVTLSKDLAGRLGLKLDETRKAKVKLADGTELEGYPVLLDRVKVGRAELRQVKAVVIPTAPGGELDGLLGMSFLREFVIQYDPANQKLIFRKFRPSS